MFSSQRKPPYPEEKDPNDPLPLYDDGVQKLDESRQQHVARVAAAQQAMNIHRKKSFHIRELTRHEGEDNINFRRRQTNRHELLQQAEEDHANQIDPSNPQTFNANYTQAWHTERANRHQYNSGQRREAWQAARRWDRQHNYDPLQRPIPVREDSDSGDELYGHDSLEATLPQSEPPRESRRQDSDEEDDALERLASESSLSSPSAANDYSPFSSSDPTASNPSVVSKSYRRCDLCAKRRKGCSGSKDGQFPCVLCSNIGYEQSRLCTLESSHEVRGTGRRHPLANLVGNSRNSSSRIAKNVPRKNSRLASRKQSIRPAPSSQELEAIDENAAPVRLADSSGNNVSGNFADHNNDNSGNDDNIDAMDMDDSSGQRPVRRRSRNNDSSDPDDRPEKNPEPSDPAWYRDGPKTARCKRCEDKDIRRCALVVTGFPCRSCEEAGVVCQDGSGKYKGRGRFKVGGIPSPKNNNNKGKRKASADASDERRGRGDNMSMSKSRRRSISPARDVVPCSNCREARRVCDGNIPCGPCILKQLHFSCRRGDDLHDHEYDEDVEGGDEMTRAMAESRRAYQEQRRFDRGLAIFSAGPSSAGPSYSNNASVGSFDNFMPVGTHLNPASYHSRAMHNEHGLASSLTAQNQAHTTTSITTGYGGVPEAPGYRAEQEMLNAQGIWNPSPADFDLSDYINDDSILSDSNDDPYMLSNDVATTARRDAAATQPAFRSASSAVEVTDNGSVDLYNASPPRRAETDRGNARRSVPFDFRELFEPPAGLDRTLLRSRTQSVMIDPVLRQQPIESQQLGDSVTFNYTDPAGGDQRRWAPARFTLDSFRPLRHWNESVDANLIDKFASWNQCTEWANYFYKKMPNYREPPTCKQGHAASCEVLNHNLDEVNTCKHCHTLQNSFNLERQYLITEATKGYVCQACARKIRIGGLGHRGHCLCSGQMRKSWVCHMHRESALAEIELNNMTAREFAVRLSEGREFCLGCYKNNGDSSSQTWGCYTCRDWVYI